MTIRMRLAQSAVLGLAALVAAGTTGAVSVQAGSAAHRADTPVLAASSHSSDVQLKSKWGNDTTDEGLKASAETGVWQADKDHGSLNWIEKRYGVQDTWSKTDSSGQKITGKGVTVAVIDTGVAPVPGLDDPGKVINGPDLSFDSQDPETRYLDGYGHGTHMAAIIAGRDANLPPGKDGQSRYTDPRYFVGMAPDARILNVKAAASDGGTDVTQVIAAVDWVVQHRNDNGMNVRVINLSYGTRSTQSYLLDPLAKAVENAWRHGIVVVVAAGNDGIASPTLTMPAADPYVVAVGAVDNRGTDGFKDDIVAPFSNGGDKARRPNLIAPGKSVVSLRVRGSAADVGHPEGLLPGDADGRFFRGSGTSQAAAVVSGAVALILQARPTLTPDQVKRLLVASADRLEDNPQPAMGAGVLNVKTALGLATPSATTTRQLWAPATGLGTLEASRGDAIVVDPANGVALTGEVDALGAPWGAAAWASASTAAAAWSGGVWNSNTWTGDAWGSDSWSGTAWAGHSWSGHSWSGLDWSGHSWSHATWSGHSWSGHSWSDANWSGHSWSDAAWGEIDIW